MLQFTKFVLARSIEISEARPDIIIKIELSRDQRNPINISSNGPHTKNYQEYTFTLFRYITFQLYFPALFYYIAELWTSKQK